MHVCLSSELLLIPVRVDLPYPFLLFVVTYFVKLCI